MGKRFATIDVGSNSVLIYIAERDEQGNWKQIDDRAEITRLGEGLQTTGMLKKEAMERTTEALCKFVELAKSYGAEQIVAVGTMALRTAKNADEFIKMVEERCGLRIEVISGEEEARLSYLAVKSGLKFPAERIVIIDVGGGSTEFIFGRGDEIERKFSLNIGAIRFTETYLKSDPVKDEELEAMLEALQSEIGELPMDFVPEALIGIGGTITNLAAIKHKLEVYDPNVVDGTELTVDTVYQLMDMLRKMPIGERKKVPGLQPKRADVIVAGAGIVYTVMKLLGIHKLTVSVRGIRHGLMYDRFGK
ncbi:MAG: Ppx/GppA family phosphatase [Candidatus Hydrothermota bacterium]|nr:MAG: Ppx/GppA family phosphatase [Candidatus Hydrothermae bacterium]